MLTFNCVVPDAYCRGVVAMDGGIRLRMAHIGKGKAKYNSCSAIVVQCSKFCFGGGGDDKF